MKNKKIIIEELENKYDSNLIFIQKIKNENNIYKLKNEILNKKINLYIFEYEYEKIENINEIIENNSNEICFNNITIGKLEKENIDIEEEKNKITLKEMK